MPCSGGKATDEAIHWFAWFQGGRRQSVSKCLNVDPCLLQDMHRDPGYLSTSRMVLESALCLALQQDALRADPYASKCPAGILTPAAAMGLVLVERLKNAGYEVTTMVPTDAAKACCEEGHLSIIYLAYAACRWIPGFVAMGTCVLLVRLAAVHAEFMFCEGVGSVSAGCKCLSVSVCCTAHALAHTTSLRRVPPACCNVHYKA